jgi:5-methylcytosine-specific restriction endonuclease McrA
MMKEVFQKECKKHGTTDFSFLNKSWRCKRCNVEKVTIRRKKNKEKLVEACGGKCAICGYSKYIGALEFHHPNPLEKDFGIGSKGLTKAYKKLLAEAKKCVLLCANCHREEHAKLSKEEDE